MADQHFINYFAQALASVPEWLREKIVNELWSLNDEEREQWERAKQAQREKALEKES